jgi:para-aminobenzoate synthetase component 1
MARSYQTFPADNFQRIKTKLLNWSSRFNIFVLLDTHAYNLPLRAHECLVAAGDSRRIRPAEGMGLDALDAFIEGRGDWIFGHLSYDLKNRLEPLQTSHPDHLGFDDFYFFVPRIVCQLDDAGIRIGCLEDDPAVVYREIMSMPAEISVPGPVEGNFQQRCSEQEYLDAVHALQAHIRRGDCYEINYCLEFFSEQARMHPPAIYTKLTELSPNPFSAYYHNGNQYLLCASPERYLRRTGRQLISQPIKGTMARIKDRPAEDLAQEEKLRNSGKERSENVMIVDLVRNDLSRICVEGSVRVDELLGIYAFPQVFQMVSTVSGELAPGKPFSEILRATFPMGSMTGAPKRKVMELTDRYEKSRRGLFSGAVGYFDPKGDFDFNVVIRSILYNAETGYLSFPAGSAITHYAEPAQEYAECMLKASAIRQVLAGG